MRAFTSMMDWDPGFRARGPDDIVDAHALRHVSHDGERGRRARAGPRFGRRRAGHSAAALASTPPLANGDGSDAISIEGAPPIDPAVAPVTWFDVSPEYFDTLGLPIKRRGFSGADAAGAPNVAIINQTLAKRFFSISDPIGRRVKVMSRLPRSSASSRTRSYRRDTPTPPEIYWPIRQFRRLAAYLVLRVSPELDAVEKLCGRRVARSIPTSSSTRC